jgi:peptide/nickel transport system substrate-binding protein
MKKFRWQLLIIFLTGAIVGILLLTQQPENTQQGVGEPVQGGSYTEALIGSMQRLNPMLDFYNTADRDVDRLLYSRLFTFDEHGQPVPDLVSNWGYSQDGTIYNIELNENARWHDGEQVTTSDIVFTVELMRNGGDYVPQDLQEFWKNVEVVDLSPTVMQFKLPEAYAAFVDYLNFGILPAHLLNGKSIDEISAMDFNIQPVGSGPYAFDHLIVEDDQIVGVALKANTEYYRTAPYIEQVTFRYYPDSASAYQAYQDQMVNGISQVSKDILKDVLAEPDLSVYTAREPEMSLVLFNLNKPESPFFADRDVRKALYMGINRQYLIDRILDGQALLADGPIFPDTWAYYASTEKVSYDPERAKQLLSDAGYTLPAEGGSVRVDEDGGELSFTLLYPDDDGHRSLAEAIQRDWTALGVGVSLEAVSYDQLINARLGSRDYQAALVDLNMTQTPDPDPYPFWDSVQATGGQNYSQWDNKIVSEYLEKARTTVNKDERTRYYRSFQVVFSEEWPALPLYYPVYSYAVSSDVQGVRMGPLVEPSDRFNTVLDWYLVSQAAPVAQSSPTPAP